MKERYFKPESIQTLTSHWLKKYGDPDKALNHPFDIKKAALIILDMQQYFLYPGSHAYLPSAEMILAGLNKAAGFFRKNNRPVIATRHKNDQQNAGMMASWWSELITADHPHFGLHPELNIKQDEILDKSQYDAFYESRLAVILNQYHVDQVVIGGLMTHLCCETTARSAFVRGYRVFFLVDGTATYNKEFHQGTLRNLGHGFAVLMSVNHLIGKGQEI